MVQTKRMRRGKKFKKAEPSFDAWEKVSSCDREVIRFMRWYLANRPQLKRLAMFVGGFQDVVQQTCYEILRAKPVAVRCKWTTFAANNVRWTLLRMVQKHILHRDRLAGYESPLVYEQDPILSLNRAELKEKVEEVIERIDNLRSLDIAIRVIQGETLESVGKRYKLTRERVRQIHAKTVRTLQKPNVARELVEFCEWYS